MTLITVRALPSANDDGVNLNNITMHTLTFGGDVPRKGIDPAQVAYLQPIDLHGYGILIMRVVRLRNQARGTFDLDAIFCLLTGNREKIALVVALTDDIERKLSVTVDTVLPSSLFLE